MSDGQRLQAEGELDEKECLNALTNMTNGKSQRFDGCTIEFYNFFLDDFRQKK